MANVIKLRKGLDINLKGAAAQELVSVKEPGFYSLVPDDYTGITPKVVVKEQEYVMAGGPLFIDKNHPELKFVSPVSGVVTSVERDVYKRQCPGCGHYPYLLRIERDAEYNSFYKICSGSGHDLSLIHI